MWPSGVAGRLDHVGRELADLDLVALAHGLVDRRNLRGLCRRRHHAAFVFLLERRDAAGVVGVMMRDQDVGELPAGGLERGLDRRRLRRVDRGGRAGRGVVQQHAVIVLQALKQLGFGGHGSILVVGCVTVACAESAWHAAVLARPYAAHPVSW